MTTTPKLYIENIIKPALARFESEPTSLELCFAVCIFISHLADVIAEHTSRNLKDVRQKLSVENKLFVIVHAFSIAAKHVVVSDNRLEKYVGLKSDDAHIAPGAPWDDGSYWDDGSSWSDIPDVVRIQAPDGNWYDLLFTTKSVTQTLEKIYC